VVDKYGRIVITNDLLVCMYVCMVVYVYVSAGGGQVWENSHHE
jgi:hypothetical protein